MLIIQGLVGPKPMAKAAGDGQTVNIPLLPHFFEGRTFFKAGSEVKVSRLADQAGRGGKSTGKKQVRIKILA